MLNINNPQVKSKTMQRLARVEGQLRGVQKMIAEDRDCKDIVQQLIAIRSAVQSASLNYIQDIAAECLLNPENQADPNSQQAAIADLIKLMGKLSD